MDKSGNELVLVYTGCLQRREYYGRLSLDYGRVVRGYDSVPIELKLELRLIGQSLRRISGGLRRMYELVDIGANLGHASYRKDWDEVIERSRQAGISKLMITGTSETISKEAAEMAEKHPGLLYFTAGVHPHDAKDWTDSTESCIRSLLSHPQCVAVGECGLDFNRNFSPPETQRDVFQKQLEIACELGRSLFIHEREAHDDMVKFLSSKGDRLPPTVIHCFTGTVDEAEKYISMGLFIGLTGFLWKDKSDNGVQAGLRSGRIPVEKIVLETDAPFMYPKINDKKLPKEVREAMTEEAKTLHKFASFNRNEPCALPAICELIAAFAGRNPEEVAKLTTANAKRIYGLS